MNGSPTCRHFRQSGAARLRRSGGEGGIRTHGGREPTAVFKTAALNHSATCPWRLRSRLGGALRASRAANGDSHGSPTVAWVMRSGGWVLRNGAIRVLAAAFLAAAALAGGGGASAQPAGLSQEGFQAWLPQLRAQALAAGVSRATVDQVFPTLAFSSRVVE